MKGPRIGGKGRKDLAPLLGTSGSRLARSQVRHGWNARSLGAVDVGHVEIRGRCLGLGDMRGKMGIFLGGEVLPWHCCISG